MTPDELLASERQNVGAGWQTLITELDRKLRAVDPGYVVDQIKEKLGRVGDLCWAAEEASLHVCEDCGSTDNVHTMARAGGYWIKTLCGGCRGEGR